MLTQTDDSVPIESLLEWGDPVQGMSLACRYADATREFKELYLLNIDAFREAGVAAISQGRFEWRASWEDYKLIKPSRHFVPRNLDPLYDQYGKPPQKQHALALGQAFVNIDAVFDGSDTGTGKTPVSGVICRELALRPFVICKKSGIYNWAKWFDLLGVDPLGIWNYEKAKIGYGEPYCTPNDPKKFHLTDRHVLILDEVHKASNKDTQNSALVVTAKAEGCKILALSATAADSPLKMYSLGYVLGLHVPRKTWTTFLTKFGCRYDQGYGWEWSGDPDDMKKLHHEIYPLRGARMRKSEIPGYPPCEIVAESYDMGKDEERIQKMWQENIEEKERLEANAMYAEGAAKLMAALQLSEMSKVEFLVAEAKELIDEGMSVAIAVRFTESRKKIMAKLKVGGIFGSQSTIERDEVIRRFQADIDRIVVVNMQAGSDSISLNDTHGKHPRVGLTCPTFSAIDLVQWFGRLNRADDVTPALYRLIYAKGTPEEAACRSVQLKINNLAALNDGDLTAGVQLMKNRK